MDIAHCQLGEKRTELLYFSRKNLTVKIWCQGLVNLFRRTAQCVLTVVLAWCVHCRGRESNSVRLKLA